MIIARDNFDAAIGTIRAAYDYEVRCAQEYREDLVAIESAARKALAVLRDVEWPGDVAHTVSGPYIICPMCERWRKVGHADDCAIAEAISDLEAVL